MISKEIKFLLTHSSIYGLGTVVSRLVSFVLLPLYTRYLTPTDYGVLQTIDVSSGIIGIVVTVGIARALSRFYYESEEVTERNRVVSTTYITYAVVACLIAPFLFSICDLLATILFQSQHYGYFFRISFATLILSSVVDIGMLYLRLIKKSFVFITITISRLILSISFNIFFIVHLQMGVLGILYSALIVSSLSALLITTGILWKTRLNFSFNVSWHMLKYSLPMIPSNLGSAAVKQSDKYFVLYFLTIADMGIYSLALKLGNAIHSLLTVPFTLAYIPRRFEIMNRNDAREIYSKIFTYYIFFIVYIGLALSILIPEILQIMVTPKFLRAGAIVPLVVLSMIIFGCHSHFDFGILQSKKTKYLAYISLICAIIQVGLNFVLIPTYGLYGAVYASIISLGTQAFLLYFISKKLYRIEYEFGRILKYILLAFIFYGISTQIQTGILLFNIGIKLLLLALFPLAVFLLRILSPLETSKIRTMYVHKIKSRILSMMATKTS
jgi:O-antigen/teichoic acid export membrane protein